MKIRFFVAGSTKLASQMAIVKVVANKLSVKYDRKLPEVSILAASFDDFGMTYQKEGQQKRYNEYILNQADMVFFIVDNEVGKETLEEFRLAYNSFKRLGRPQIQVFVKEEHLGAVIRQLYDTVGERIENYQTTYRTDQDLESSLTKSITDLFIDPIFEANPLLLRIQQSFNEKKENQVIQETKKLFDTKLDDWELFYKVGKLCAGIRNEQGNTLAQEAFKRAKGCLINDDELINLAEICVKQGAMKRRLGSFIEALSSVELGYQIVKNDCKAYLIREDAYYNLIILYTILQRDSDMNNLIDEMKVFLVDDDINAILNKANETIRKSRIQHASHE